jgi:4-hydroxybenzoate polyprenyltransferase
MKQVRGLIQLLRPHQWTKNLFVFAPPLFAKKLFDPHCVLVVSAAFFLFCVASGSVYVFNDIVDAKADRLHPRKKLRPVASGATSVSAAAVLSFLLFTAAVGLSFWLDRSFGAIVVCYLLVNACYSLFAKGLVIVDVLCISFGFFLRILGGSVILDIYLSNWIIICGVLLSLLLAFSKRRHEIVLLSENGGSPGPALEGYSPHLLDQFIVVVTAATLVSYMIYTMDERTVEFFGTRKLVFTIPFVLYGIFRYLYLVHRKQDGGDPALVMLTDRPLLISIVLWVILCLAIIHGI